MEIEKEKNRPIWDCEAANPETSKKIREALREVHDPELGLDLIQLGMIRNVIITGDQVSIKMILTSPFCPYGSVMIQAAQQKIQAVIQLHVQVELLNEPWDKSMMEDGLGADWGLY